MNWLTCCCYCFRSQVDDKMTTLDDSSSLIQRDNGQANGRHAPLGATTQMHAFYVPRRHSSFQPSSFTPISVQPGRSHSDSCSSSDEEGVPEQRARCWSTIPATSVTDVTTLIANRRGLTSSVSNRCVPSSDISGGKITFDRHILDEIVESDQQPETAPLDTEIYGHLTFTVAYDEQEQRLTVFLKQGEGLPRKTEEPYSTFVKMALPSSSGKNFRVSRTVKKNFNPYYKEEHVFHTNKSKWKSDAQLRLSVFDYDRQGRHDSLGHALLPLCRIGSNGQDHRLPLTPMALPVKNLGQILVGLLYSPIQSRLSVHVIKARHLRIDPEFHKRQLKPISRDSIDTFCKVTLTCGGQKVKTCRSRSLTGSDPFYDFRSNFVVPPQYLRDTAVIIAVVSRSTLVRQGTTLGRSAALGPYVELGDGNATQWGRMIQEGRSVVQWRNIFL